MEIVHGISALAPQHRGSVVSIGNFDGVHRGHQAVVNTLLARADEQELPATIVTFEPLAREFFQPDSVDRLSSFREKCGLLEALGVDRVLCIEFDAAFANTSPEAFIEDVLVRGLGTRFLSVGDDFRFGHKRRGDFALLEAAGAKAKFSVRRHDTFLVNGERVSSQRIRDALNNSAFGEAETLLGRRFSISGCVEEGQKLGRTINFPTANISLASRRVPVHGVYAVQASFAGEPTQHMGVANVGVRPTVDGRERRLEVHLFDFDADVYGQTMAVSFIKKIRDEKAFASFDELTHQIARDADEARRVLTAATR